MNKADLNTLTNNLPIIPGILRKEEYLNSAVLIPLVFKNGEYHFLFEKRSEKIRQGGEICFPGGEFDPSIDKSYKDTAIRETHEEVGIESKDIDVIGILDTLIGPTGVTVNSFIGVINNNNLMDLNFDLNEVEKTFLIPVSFFVNNEPENYFVRMEIHPSEIDKNGIKFSTLPVKDLQLPDRYSKPWRGGKHKIFVYKTPEGIIWGITAVLIHEIVKRLK